MLLHLTLLTSYIAIFIIVYTNYTINNIDQEVFLN